MRALNPVRGGKKGVPAADRIKARVVIDPVSGCWVWQGAVENKGYGLISIAAVTRLVHRVAYEAHVGPIPEGMQIDHLRRNHRCCNPAHLEVVTPRENTMRGLSTQAQYARRTCCPMCGGPFPPNISKGRRGRECRPCEKRRKRESYARKKAGL